MTWRRVYDILAKVSRGKLGEGGRRREGARARGDGGEGW